MAVTTAVTPATLATAGTTAAPVPSGAEADTRVANRRLGGRKDRTGCITCKIRRVKCDEEKPACKRCTSTGRTCDGYAPVTAPRRSSPSDKQTPKQGQTTAVQHTTSANLPSLACARPRQFCAGGASVTNQQEHLVFQFFAYTGASSLAGCTDVDFWTRLVPQCAQADAAIYHASVAVGALLMGRHQASSSSSSSSSSSLSLTAPHSELTTLAIERQNKAIQSTVRGMVSPNKRPSDADAMTFIMLFCIEALQGREVEALQLFQHGIQALAAQASKGSSNHRMAPGLAAQLDRLRLQCGMFNGGTANAESPVLQKAIARLLSNPPMEPFASLDAARDELSELIAAVQHTVAARWGDVEDPATDPLNNVMQTQALDTALHGWRARFEQYVSQSNDTTVVPTASLLRLRYFISRVWMADAPGRSEMAYDDEHVQVLFADIAAEAECYLGSPGVGALGLGSFPPPTIAFTFEMGHIPPLYWALLKCRYPRLRRRLLALLRQAPAQEGLWSRGIMVQVAERVIAHEEATMAVAGLSMPPSASRIKVVRIGLRTTLPDGRRGDVVECFGMPYGIDGGLHVVLDFVAFCDDAISV
ncbi:hypothetical protein Sste5346_006162 [Sporothrix stenoceras]|uniref:Zn(2)-C6 fungal-type domain-containing protein n=1 Tax=Sporothrix stenoceras TaxID=5173 RepID=A0ABR3Z144_9PEZI